MTTRPPADPDPLAEALEALGRALRTWAAAHPQAVPLISALGRTLASLGDARAQPPAPEPAQEPGASGARPGPMTSEERTISPPPSVEPHAAAPTVPVLLKLGGASLSVPVVSGPAGGMAPAQAPQPAVAAAARPERPIEPIDLDLIARRCALKREACLWAVEKRRRLSAGADYDAELKERQLDLLSRMKAVRNCFLGVLERSVELWLPDDRTMEDLAEAFENLRLSADLAAHFERAGDLRQDLLEVVAEAQSAVRAGVQRVLFTTDRDQSEFFEWIRQQTQAFGVYLGRFMRLDDSADPGGHAELRERLGALRARLDELRGRDKALKRLLGQVRYHAKPLLAGASVDAAYDWGKVAEAVESLLALGVQASDAELRDALLPLADEIPEELCNRAGVARVLREIDRYLATASAPETTPARPRPVSEAVLDARRLVRGMRVVMIGGECRANAKRLLERELEFDEVCWISSREHTSLERFEAEIARAETDLVMVAIRWSSHSYEGVKQLCEKHGKLYVRLPAGYHPNQVAAQILEQRSRQLEELAAYLGSA